MALILSQATAIMRIQHETAQGLANIEAPQEVQQGNEAGPIPREESLEGRLADIQEQRLHAGTAGLEMQAGLLQSASGQEVTLPATATLRSLSTQPSDSGIAAPNPQVALPFPTAEEWAEHRARVVSWLDGNMSQAMDWEITAALHEGRKASRTGEVFNEDFNYTIPRPVNVLLWTPGVPHRPKLMSEKAPNCKVERGFIIEQGGIVKPDKTVDISAYDIVLFNLASLERDYFLPKTKPRGQLWVALCTEARDYAGLGEDETGSDADNDCSLLDDEFTMQFMDGVGSYDPDSEFPAFYTPPGEDQMRRASPDFYSQHHTGSSPLELGALATYTSSDCRASERNTWVHQLNLTLAARLDRGSHKKHAPVLFLGRCGNNVFERPCLSSEAIWKTVLGKGVQDGFIKTANRCMARPFALIAENTKEPWYVTEKIWGALASGSVPVYFGPPEAKELVPPGSALFADEYATLDALVQEMLTLNQQKALEWKKKPVEEWGLWTVARRFNRDRWVMNVCEAAARRPPVARSEPAQAVPPRSSFTKITGKGGWRPKRRSPEERAAAFTAS